MRLTLVALALSLSLAADELPDDARAVLDAYVKALDARNVDEMWELYGERERQKVQQQVQGGDRGKYLADRATSLMGKGGKIEVKEVILGATISIAHVRFPSGQVVSLRFGKEDGAMRILDSGRIRNARNEVHAQAMLKQLVSTEGVWRQTDSDRNGCQDYWTQDVAGFYYTLDAAGNELKYIDARMATADRTGISTYRDFEPDPSEGYWLRVMTTDESGNPYALDDDGDGVSSTHSYKFGFCAYPVEYGVTGQMTYIVNEEGVVYEKDLGADAKDGCDTWPDADPMLAGWAPSE